MSGDHTPKLKPNFRNSSIKRLSCGSTNAYKNPLIQDSSPGISGIVSPSSMGQNKRPCYKSRLSSTNNSFKSPLLHSPLSACVLKNEDSRTPPTKQSTNKSRRSSTSSNLTSSSVLPVARDIFHTPKTINYPQDDDNSLDGDSLKKTVNQLQQEEEALDKEINHLKEQGYKIEELKWYIDKLHEYNEIKDVAQMVMGRIAEIEGVTVKEVHKEFGLEDDD